MPMLILDAADAFPRMDTTLPPRILGKEVLFEACLVLTDALFDALRVFVETEGSVRLIVLVAIVLRVPRPPHAGF